ncbi:hypothetical protein FisN_22Lh061 [Fistulifera solaris]|uniref:Uncharacterized protein n=1 Tax=Fistulifera solaris TaxID=1519565 RepID=A0A1Z5JBQ6_FISSO|nr:hypothetical protein FisN_22Lh061 [Fistulifera solaris]|eukprot:GAX11389.1 hypothetical protein FisN_22Lh061 [Fistulifera solaris]
MKDLMGLFASRKGDREMMLAKRQAAWQMIQLVDSEEASSTSSSVPPTSTMKRLKRNFFQRSKPVFRKFHDEIDCDSPSNAYQPPPAHLFPSNKAITLTGTHSTDASSTASHEYQPPAFRIAALEPSVSIEEVQRACSPSIESDRRSSSSFVQFAFDPDFQRIEELAMFGEPVKVEETKQSLQNYTKTSTKKKKASLEFPTLSFENMAKQNAELPDNSVVSPSRSVVSLTNATITGFDDGVPLTYTEDTIAVGSKKVHALEDPFKIDAISSHSSGDLLGTRWIGANVSLPETSSQGNSSLIESIIRPKKSSSWDLECRKPKQVGTRDPSPRVASQQSFDQHWEEEFGDDAFPESRHLDVRDVPDVKKIQFESASFFMEEPFSEIGFPVLKDAQPVNEIVINEQTNCIKGLPASAIAASMIFRQTIAEPEEEPEEEEEEEEEESVGYFPDGTPMQVRAQEDTVSCISSLTESAFHHPRGLDVWGRQAQNVINHWNFAAKQVREERACPTKSSQKSSSASDELMNMFSP